MQAIETRLMGLFAQFAVPVDYVCREHVDGNIYYTFPQVDRCHVVLLRVYPQLDSTRKSLVSITITT